MTAAEKQARHKIRTLRVFVALRRKGSQLRDLITAMIASYLLFTLVINPLFFDALSLKGIASMGVEIDEHEIDGAAEPVIQEPSNLAQNRLDNAQLRFIFDQTIGAGFATQAEAARAAKELKEAKEAEQAETSASAGEPVAAQEAQADRLEETAIDTAEPALLTGESKARADLLHSLLSGYGVFFDGPYQLAKNRWELTIYRYSPSSDAATQVAAVLGTDENPNSNLYATSPVVAIRLSSRTGVFEETSMSYQVQLLGLDSRVLSTTPVRPLFVRSAWKGLPIRPVQISLEPQEFGDEVVAELEQLQSISSWLEKKHRSDFSAISESFDRSKREKLANLFAATVRVLMSSHASHLDHDDHQAMGSDEIAQLPPTFASQLQACRIVNGVNQGGLLNFLIFVLVVWGLVSLLSRDRGSIQTALKRANDLIGLLPMLGFLGTLYGMLLAFSASGAGGADLISYIGISLDTTILAVCGTILLNGTLMWKIRKLEAAGLLPESSSN